MTTITIERALGEKIIEKFAACGCEVCTRQSIEALKAALAAPATAPEPVAWMSPKRFYRTRAMALINGEQLIEPLYRNPPATAPAQPDELDQLRKDAERFVWYENNSEKVLNIGPCWYSRKGYGLPMKRRNGFREAIDAAMKEKP